VRGKKELGQMRRSLKRDKFLEEWRKLEGKPYRERLVEAMGAAGYSTKNETWLRRTGERYLAVAGVDIDAEKAGRAKEAVLEGNGELKPEELRAFWTEVIKNPEVSMTQRLQASMALARSHGMLAGVKEENADKKKGFAERLGRALRRAGIGGKTSAEG